MQGGTDQTNPNESNPLFHNHPKNALSTQPSSTHDGLPTGEDQLVMGGVAPTQKPGNAPVTMTMMSSDSNTAAVSIDVNMSMFQQSGNQLYSDPGEIATSPQEQQQMQDALKMNNNAMQGNITISANDIKRELEEGDYIGQTDYVNSKKKDDHWNDNAISSFIRNTVSVIEVSQNNRSSTMESQIIEQHGEYMRRFKGYPPEINTNASPTAATAAMRKENNLPSILSFQPEPCTGGKFLVTKLRNWRTGYERILSLHKSYFTTLDPETNEITNLWKYTQVKQCQPSQQKGKEDDCIIVDVVDENGRGGTKLKFKSRVNCRHELLVAFVKCKYLNDLQLIGSGNNYALQKQIQEQNPLFECQRQTRHNTRIQTLLVCAPHGLVELDAQSSSTIPIQTYSYKNIRTVCFIGDEGTGIVFYVGGVNSVPYNTSMLFQTSINNPNNNYNFKIDPSKDGESICEEKVFFITSSRRNGSGRSDLVTTLQHKFDAVGLPLKFSESVRLDALIQYKLNKGTFAGGCIGMFKVMKISQRRECTLRAQGIVGSGKPYERYLVLTQNGYVLECEDDENENSSGLVVVNCRKLRDVACLIRHSHHTTIHNDIPKMGDVQNLFSIEYKDGLCRTYSSTKRDTIITSLLDSTVNLCRNYNTTVTDISTLGYSFSSLESSKMSGSSNKNNETGIFQSDPVEVICLRRVQNVAMNTNFYMDICLSPQNNKNVCDDDCFAITEICREFNTNVTLSGIRNLPNEQNVIKVSISNLWGIVSKLLTIRHNQSYGDGKTQINNAVSLKETDGTLSAVLQTLYRLMLTPHGYSTAIDDEIAMNVFSTMMSMITDLPLYWSLKCASALLLPRPFATEREIETESKNKTQLLHRMPNLVTVLIKNNKSSLVLMVVSNMLESVLCSHHETTDSDDFSYIADRLAEGYPKLMQLLYSEASVIVENTALLLYIIQTHSSQTASLVKEVALNSGLLLQHFYNAIFSLLDGQRYFSRFLCSLWFSGSSTCLEKHLLSRMIPSGFFSYLSMPALSDAEEEQLDDIQRGFESEKKQRYQRGSTSFGDGTNIVRLRERIKIATERDDSKRSTENFRIFFHVLEECHSIPDLIWNHTTQKELKIALENELKSIGEETNRIGGFHKIAWNHQQFKVKYPSLESEVRVGTIYLRLWLETGDSFIKTWRNPLRLFELLFRRFLCELDRDDSVTNMCIRCLERLYRIHASKIGPFPDIMFLMRSMIETCNMETQHRLLHLISSLVGGTSESTDNEEGNFIQNAEQLLNIESFQILCQFVSLGHDRTKKNDSASSCDTTNNDVDTCSNVPSQSIAVWFYVEGDSEPSRDNVKGPVSVSELRDMYFSGKLSPNSCLRTAQTDGKVNDMTDDFFNKNWRKLEDVWQLRCDLVLAKSSTGVFSKVELSSIALNCLLKIIGAHQSVDSRGIAYVPVPVGKRLLCEHGNAISGPFISIVCQMLLCGHNELIKTATSIIIKAMEHNDKACAKLYFTGLFYFAFSKIEDDAFEQVVTLVHQCHLRQDCNTIMDGCGGMRVNSALADMLPCGLFNVLVNADAKTFAQAFSGSFDTPELIWNPNMKKHLQNATSTHLGIFPLVLNENIMEQYDFGPIPKVEYEELQDDVFCYKYYLKNLCDEEHFSDWPITNPSEVFIECIRQWTGVMNPGHDTKAEELIDESLKLLSLESSYSLEDLRKAYCSLARKCHIDNTGLFQKARNAYRHLSASLTKRRRSNVVRLRINDEPISEEDVDGLEISIVQMKSVYLLLKTQLLICKRYSSDLIHMKYPAYSLLFSCLKHNPKTKEGDSENSIILDSCLMKVNRLEFTRTLCDLIFNTCLVSPSNAEELVENNGLMYLEDQFDFYVEALSTFAAEFDEDNRRRFNLTAEIIIHIVHTIAGVAFFDFGRIAILSLENSHRLCTNWRKCLDFDFPNGQPAGVNLLSRYALEGIASLSKNEKLQEMLVGSHIVWTLLKSMLAYDPSIETTPMNAEFFESSISKAENNFHAFLATRALGMLCGVMKDDFSTPPNGRLFNAMRNILTQPLANMLSNSQSNELLLTLNLNVESPLRLWDEKMRSELSSFVHTMEGVCRDEEFQEVDVALSASSKFEYSNLSDEVNIGGVYIRIFNRMDAMEAFQGLPDGSNFVISLLEFIGRSMKKSLAYNFTDEIDVFATEDSVDAESHWFPVTDNRFIMAVLSVRQLVQLDGVVDDQLCTSTGILVLFGLISLPQPNKAHDLGHEILQLMSCKKFFANAVGHQSAVLRRLISTLLIHQCSDEGEMNESTNDDHVKWLGQKWSILESLARSPEVAGALVKSSAWLELLGSVCSYEKFVSFPVGRMGASKTLARLLWDPITTGTAGVLLQKFLPVSLILIMKEKGAELFLEAFDKDSKHPELIWESSMREELKNTISEQLDAVVANKSDKLEDFHLDSMFMLRYTKLHQELYVGGVYVNLFLKEPAFNLRDPSGFLENLMIRWTQVTESILETKGGANLESQNILQQLTEACKIMCAHSYLCVKLSPWGYMKNAIMYLHASIEYNLVKCPLDNIMDLLHFSSSERVNVESIIDVCDKTGKNGVVDGVMKAIRAGNQHPSFMLETLKIIIKDALGNANHGIDTNSFENAQGIQANVFSSVEYVQEFGSSPAPGKESVKNMKKLEGSDPLSMLLGGGLDDQMHSNQPTSTVSSARRPPDNSNSRTRQKPNQTKNQKQNLMHTSKKPQKALPEQSIPPQRRAAQNLPNPLHHNPSRMPQNRNLQPSTQYKHSVPRGRGVKPVRNQTNVKTRNNTDDPLSQNVSYPSTNTVTKQQRVMYASNTSSKAQTNQASPSPRYQPSMNTMSAQSLYNPNGHRNASNPQLLQNHQQVLLQTNNATAPINHQQGLPTHAQYTNHVNNNLNANVTQPVQPLYPTQQHIHQPTYPEQPPQQNNHQPQNIYSSSQTMTTTPQVHNVAKQPEIEDPKIDYKKEAEDRIKKSNGAPGSAKGRNILLSSIVSCAFVEFLVREILIDDSLNESENVKIQAEETLKLLTMDPGYGLKFELILKELNYELK